MSGGATPPAPEGWLDLLPEYNETSPQVGFGLFRGTIKNLENPVYYSDGSAVGVVYSEPGVHYAFVEETNRIEKVPSPGSDWVQGLSEATGIQLSVIRAGVQEDNLRWSDVKFKWIPA